jgi:hypothetical protein
VISTISRRSVLRYVLITGAAIVLIAGLTIISFWIASEYRTAKNSAIDLKKQVATINKRVTQGTAAIPGGTSDLQVAVSDRYELMVVGHIRFMNGFDRSADATQINSLASVANQLRPAYMVFAGDTIESGDSAHLDYLENQLRQKFAVDTAFVIGNHDIASSNYFESESFKAVYNAPNWHTDIGNLRLVVLNTTWPGDVGLNADSIEYAKNVLDGSYKSAVIVMHHAVWLPPELGDFANASPENLGLDPAHWVSEVLPLLSNQDIVIGGDGGNRSSTFSTTICGVRHYLTGWSNEPNLLDTLAIYLGENGVNVDLIALDRSTSQFSTSIPAHFPNIQPICTDS